MIKHLPKEFTGLDCYAEKWCLATMNERWSMRLASTKEELRNFYDAILPRMEDALEYIDQYPIGELSGEPRNLYDMTMSLAEIAPHVELYRGNPNVPHAFEETRFISLRGNFSE